MRERNVSPLFLFFFFFFFLWLFVTRKGNVMACSFLSMMEETDGKNQGENAIWPRECLSCCVVLEAYHLLKVVTGRPRDN